MSPSAKTIGSCSRLVSNLSTVAKNLGSKSEKECRAHYVSVYLSSDENLPKPIHTSSLELMNKGECAQEFKKATVPKSDVAGYMPLRGDFDVEHDNDAEELLADMEFHEVSVAAPRDEL